MIGGDGVLSCEVGADCVRCVIFAPSAAAAADRADVARFEEATTVATVGRGEAHRHRGCMVSSIDCVAKLAC